MSVDESQQSEVMTLPMFDNQDDSMLEAMQSISSKNDDAANFNYLHECMSSLESKDSGVNLSPESVNGSRSDLQLENFDDNYQNSDSEISTLNINFIKMGNMFLQSKNLENVEKMHGEDNDNIKYHNKKLIFDNYNIILENSVNTEKSCDIKMNNATLCIMENSIETLKVLHPDITNSLCNSNKVSGSLYDDFEVSSSCTLTGLFPKGHKCQSFEITSSESDVQDCEKIVNNELYSDTDLERDSDLDGQSLKNKEHMKLDDLDNLQEEVKTCPQCPMTFRYKRHLDRHLEGHLKNNCPHCSAKFARRKHLDVHLFRAHGEKVMKYPHLCDACSRSFPKRILLNRHRAKHQYETGKVCSNCGEMLKTQAAIREHMERHNNEKEFKCDRCPQAFNVEQTYLIHVQNHDTHKCPQCDATFASKKRANEHFKLTHSAKPKALEIEKNGLYYCAECRHGFIKKDSYFRHLQTALHLSKANNEVPFEGIFSCPVCAKELTTRRARDQHIRRVHKDEKKFSCNTFGCTFNCTNKSDLDRHRQLHVEMRNIICEHCGKTFTSVSILNDHVLYVHNKERQFICEECGRAFKRNSLLSRHKLSHQEVRPFACSQCSAAFKRSHHLTRHMETCHRITMERKKKVVKLMKTEDGQLVPIIEKPKQPKVKNMKMKKEVQVNTNPHTTVSVDKSSIASEIDVKSSSVELQHTHSFSSTGTLTESAGISVQMSNLLPVVDMMPQFLSLVDINSGQVVTVEVANPDTLPLNDLVDQFETNCNEMLGLSGYQDLGFQNADQSYYDHSSYSELPLENVSESPLLLDPNGSKMDSLPTIENYLTQPFPPFLNL
ncbi:zinc finger protein 184 isoform X1 [Cephus cinctus]|uniref:Zinc finger protein 184 isoform X1 n=1 Tax=Cephus cinctus TaxID=211228 RepID=A0AAJ7C3D7_CEPCN|nr:zinc finger protein 184 isoform X1 [Cephus cinctus]